MLVSQARPNQPEQYHFHYHAQGRIWWLSEGFCVLCHDCRVDNLIGCSHMTLLTHRNLPNITRPFLPRAWNWKQSALGLVGSGLRDYTDISVLPRWKSTNERYMSMCTGQLDSWVIFIHSRTKTIQWWLDKHQTVLMWLLRSVNISCRNGCGLLCLSLSYTWANVYIHWLWYIMYRIYVLLMEGTNQKGTIFD